MAVHGLMADSAGGAWTFGGSILTFLFPMLLFIGVAAALFVLYTKPEAVPGHDAAEHPVAYTRYPGRPAEGGAGSAAAGDAGAPAGSVPPDSREPGAGE
jgi:hypothetical protein